MKGIFRLISIVAVIFSGCSGTHNASISDGKRNSPHIDSLKMVHQTLDHDSSISASIDGYRDTLMDIMGEPLTVLKSELNFDKPESTLGNLAADILRFRAARELRTFIHVGVINEDSFRIYLNEGEVNLGQMYELMPYDNHLVILTLTGNNLIKLMGNIAFLGGAPISGVRMNIDRGKARGILVNSEVVDPDRNYFVATSNYLADGNGPFEALWKYENRIDLDLLIRDTLIEYFKNQYELEPVLDARIR